MPENKTEYQTELEFMDSIGIAKDWIIFVGLDEYDAAELLSKFKQHLIDSEEHVQSDRIKHDTEIVNRIMEIDWQGTKEFCENNNYPVPYYTGDIKSSSDLFLGVDAKRWHVAINYAKDLRRGKVVPDPNKVISDEEMEAEAEYAHPV